MTVFYNERSEQIAVGEMLYGLYWELEYDDKLVLFASGSPQTFNWVIVGSL